MEAPLMVRIAKYLPWIEALFLIMLAVGWVMLYQRHEAGLLIISLVGLTATYFISAYKPIEILSNGEDKFGMREMLAWSILPKVCWISCAVSTLGWLLFFINPDNVGYQNMLIIGALSIGAAVVMIVYLISTGVRQIKRTIIAAAFALIVTTANANATAFAGCSIIRPSSDGWLAVRSGPGTQHRITRKLLSGREVYVQRTDGNWHFISTIVTKNGTTEDVTGWMYGPMLRPVPCEDGCQ